MFHESDDNTNRNWCSWYSHQSINKGIGWLGNKRTSGDHPNLLHYWDRQEYREETWRLKETFCHSNYCEKPSANAGMKNPQKRTNHNHNNNSESKQNKKEKRKRKKNLLNSGLCFPGQPQSENQRKRKERQLREFWGFLPLPPLFTHTHTHTHTYTHTHTHTHIYMYIHTHTHTHIYIYIYIYIYILMSLCVSIFVWETFVFN